MLESIRFAAALDGLEEGKSVNSYYRAQYYDSVRVALPNISGKERFPFCHVEAPEAPRYPYLTSSFGCFRNTRNSKSFGKSRHIGFMLSISATFLALRHFFTSVSRAIAFRMYLCSS